MGSESYVSKDVVSRRTLAYGPDKGRTMWNAVNAIANRTREIRNRSGLTEEQRERVRRAGNRMLTRVLSEV